VLSSEPVSGCWCVGGVVMTASSADSPHRRKNALTGEWVTVSPQRTKRPWQGDEAAESEVTGVTYDPDCYLCPGNTRANGLVNPDYSGPWAFDNDFPALFNEIGPNETGRNERGPDEASLDETRPADALSDAAAEGQRAATAANSLFCSEPLSGRCRVLCYSPDHSKTLTKMTEGELSAVVQLWSDEVRQLRKQYRWVQVFENKGAMMGCSNPHPHGQIWAVNSLPTEAVKESTMQAAWFEAQGSVLLDQYRADEERSGERMVVATEHWNAVVPYWATWPYETLLLPRRHIDHLDGLMDEEQVDLACLLKSLLGAYDRLFATACPYTMGWHGTPGAESLPDWQLHAHIYPPLLRSATIRKHMVGYEMLSEAQRDLTPEVAAEQLRQAISTAN
jgi:UDPglucose--hexose-1-phosphate uridylyltransferase